MRVRNLDTKGNTLAAAFTFSHGTCTSCSEVRNQNNQLDYCLLYTSLIVMDLFEDCPCDLKCNPNCAANNDEKMQNMYHTK